MTSNERETMIKQSELLPNNPVFPDIKAAFNSHIVLANKDLQNIILEYADEPRCINKTSDLVLNHGNQISVIRKKPSFSIEKNAITKIYTTKDSSHIFGSVFQIITTHYVSSKELLEAIITHQPQRSIFGAIRSCLCKKRPAKNTSGFHS